MKSNGIEVLLDNRDCRAGEKFADADLIAAPIRLIVSAKNLEQNKIEVKYRVNNYDTTKLPDSLGADNYVKIIQDLITELKKH